MSTRVRWRNRTVLSSSQAFQSQYRKLLKDRSTGAYADSVRITLPESFDGRSAWKGFIKPVRDQGSCGACWAFASTFALQTRLAICTRGKYNLDLAPAAMVLCNMGSDTEYAMAKKHLENGEPYDFNLPYESVESRRREVEATATIGCEGETLLGAWQYLYRFGVPEEYCFTYDNYKDDDTDLSTHSQGETLKACCDVFGSGYDTCPVTKKPLVLHSAYGYYHIPGVPRSSTATATASSSAAADDESAPPSTDVVESGTEENIRRDIYHWGPVSTGFTVHSDFLDWDGYGVYRWDGKSEEQGGHAVVLMGWGTESDGTKYWIVRNSWGDQWGDAGYFKFLRGENHCSIEENIVVGLPNLFGFRLYLEWPLLYKAEDLVVKALWGVTSSGLKTTSIEAIVTGRNMDTAAVGDMGYVYKPGTWPDVSELIAADIRTIKFRVGGSLLHNNYAKAGVAVAVLTTAGLCVLALVLKGKRRRF